MSPFGRPLPPPEVGDVICEWPHRDLPIKNQGHNMTRKNCWKKEVPRFYESFSRNPCG